MTATMFVVSIAGTAWTAFGSGTGAGSGSGTEPSSRGAGPSCGAVEPKKPDVASCGSCAYAPSMNVVAKAARIEARPIETLLIYFDPWTFYRRRFRKNAKCVTVVYDLIHRAASPGRCSGTAGPF